MSGLLRFVNTERRGSAHNDAGRRDPVISRGMTATVWKMREVVLPTRHLKKCKRKEESEAEKVKVKWEADDLLGRVR
jgi:hypothetical protein